MFPPVIRSSCSDSLPHLSLLERKLQAVKQMNTETDRKPIPLGKWQQHIDMPDTGLGSISADKNF